MSHRNLFYPLLITAAFLGTSWGHVAYAQSISITPSTVMQGEPLLLTLVSTTSTSSLSKVSINGSKVNFFTYKGEAVAFFGVDLRAKTGTTSVDLYFKNGRIEHMPFTILARPHIEAPLGIPQKLGGTSTTSVKKLISDLGTDQYQLTKKTPSTAKQFWRKDFVFPISKPIVTDSYGYSRVTAGEEIAHKGTDFRALPGTPVFAINRGVVRISQYYRTFGNLVAVDHGYGLYSLYLHLSKRLVKEGELVSGGQKIGLSGDTGYAEGAHLHLSIRSNGIAIDPEKFFKLLGVTTTPSR
jgi:murein DD-endopeptidase MepM/ murein hydrolase activator NlpD